MVKRILLLGLAAAALAIALPAIVAQSGLGEGVAQAQTAPVTDPEDQADPPEAPDEGDSPGEDDEGSGDDEGDDDDDEQASAPRGNTAPRSEESDSGASGMTAPQTPVVQVSSQRVSDVDTGTIPQGGIQAGAGGTADDGTGSALLLGSAVLMLMLTAGGLVLRRRGFES